MAVKIFPKIDRSNGATPNKDLAGGAYDFVFSDNLEDWCRNRQLTAQRNADKRRTNNGNRKHFSGAIGGK